MDPSNSSRRAGPSSSSPFPFGTPLNRTAGSILSPTSPNSATVAASSSSSSSATPRSRLLRGRDLYGGPIMFGGSSSLKRSNRLLHQTASSAPYTRSNPNRSRLNPRVNTTTSPPANASALQTSVSDPSISSETMASASLNNSSNAAPISSTAKAILDTLEKMNTPLKDAQKIPVPRAERRRALAEELMERTTFGRRRPRLGNNGVGSPSSPGKNALNGPPVRTRFSLVNNPSGGLLSSPGQRPVATTPTVGRTTPKKSSAVPVYVERRAEPTNASGKLRTRIGDKAKDREAAKALEECAEVPEYLKQSSNNPFLDMKAMPQFGGATSTSTSAATPSSSSSSFFSTLKNTSPAATNKVTAPAVTEAASTTSSPFTKSQQFPSSTAASELRNGGLASSVSTAFKSPSKMPPSSSSGKEDFSSSPLAKFKPRPPISGTNSISASSPGTIASGLSSLSNAAAKPASISFSFSDPLRLSSGNSVSSSNSKSASVIYTFAAPEPLHREQEKTGSASAASSLTLKTSNFNSSPHGNSSLLPDLTRNSSSGMTFMSSGSNNATASFGMVNNSKASSPNNMLMKTPSGTGSGFMGNNSLSKGSNRDQQLLPDVTAGGGQQQNSSFMKTGSVMDILGTGSWKSSSNTGNSKPWS